MKLQHYSLETALDFDLYPALTLSCENPSLFSQLTGDLYSQSKGGDGQWTLWHGKNLDLGKNVCYLVDFHGLSFSDKKATNLLLENLKNLAYNENHTVATHNLLGAISKYFLDLSIDLDYPITFKDEVELSQLFKAVPISFLDESTNLYEKLSDYVVLLSRLTTIKLLVCANLRCYLSFEQLDNFYRHCIVNGINLLCIEGFCSQYFNQETVLTVDSDRCEFYSHTGHI